MAVGGGDAFSLPATLLTVVLLWSFLQWSAPWWLTELARRHPENESRWRMLDLSLTSLPAALVLLTGLDLLRAHLADDLTYASVAGFDDAKWFVLLFCFALSVIVLEAMKRDCSLFGTDDEKELRSHILRWHGFLWPYLLLAFIPSDVFAVHTMPLAAGESGSLSTVNALILTIAGISLGVWTHAVARSSQRQLATRTGQGGFESLSVFIAGALVLLAMLSFDGVHPTLSMGAEFAESVVLGNETEFALCTSLFVMLLVWPCFLDLLTRVHWQRGQAKGRRFLALTRTFSHTMVFTWVSGVVILEPLPNIAGWYSAMWLSFTLLLPLAVAGLFGALLPLAGIDARPRPEVWGFYLAMTLALQFLTIRDPFTTTLVPGLAVSMMSLPLLATHPERRADLSGRRRGIESIMLISLSIITLWCFHRMMDGDPSGYLLGSVGMVTIPIAGLLLVFLQGSDVSGVMSGTPETGEDE